MTETETHSSGKYIIPKTLAILLSLVLLICLLIPIQNARLNTQEQYRELYNYKQQASVYYRTISIARKNLDRLSDQLNTTLQKEPITSNGILAAHSVLKENSDVLILQRKLSSLVGLYLYDLKKLPDPGHADLVNAVNDYFDIFTQYHDLLLSPPKDASSYCKNLSEIRQKISKQDSKLRQILIDLK